jgi:hypothetical protein
VNSLSTKVFISLSSIPERIEFPDSDNNIGVCLSSLLLLNYDNYEIHLNIPYIHKKSGKKYVIPKWLQELEKNNSILKIFRTEDFGPPTKIAPTLKRVNDENSYIIILDDDFAYDKDLIKNHLNKHQQHPNCAIGYAGLGTKIPNIYFCTCVAEDTEVSILEAYKSISYKRSYFKEDFFTDFLPHSWNDDIMLSSYMGKYGIKRIVAKYDKQVNFETNALCLPLVGNILNYKIGENIGCNLFRKDQDNDYLFNFMKLGYIKYPIP